MNRRRRSRRRITKLVRATRAADAVILSGTPRRISNSSAPRHPEILRGVPLRMTRFVWLVDVEKESDAIDHPRPTRRAYAAVDPRSNRAASAAVGKAHNGSPRPGDGYAAH